MPIINQAGKSNLSLDGTRKLSNREFGYFGPSNSVGILHNTFSLNANPVTSLKDFNGTILSRKPSTLDELDPIAPSNPNVTQYKSSPGRKYKDLGPTDGRF